MILLLACTAAPPAATDTADSADTAETGDTGVVDPDDRDGDGVPAAEDCDDGDPAVTLATEIPIPEGPFTRGRDDGSDASPAREITLSAFCLDTHEVTNVEFTAFLAARAAAGTPNVDDEGRVLYDFDDDDDDVPERIREDLTVEPGYEDHPVTEVYHWSAEAYCASLGKALPTEAQWEKAARGLDDRMYPWGEDVPDCLHGNLRPGAEGVDPDGHGVEPCVDDTTPVGSYPDFPGPYGHLDLAGNVAEWVHDWYREDYYAESPDADPTGPDSGWSDMFPDGAREARVTRGGSYASGQEGLTTSGRYIEPADGTSNGVGFRCARAR